MMTADEIITAVNDRTTGALARWRKDPDNDVVYGEVVALAALSHHIDPARWDDNLADWYARHLDARTTE